MEDQSDDIPRGLVIPGLGDESRRSALRAFLVVSVLSGLALIWPVYPLAVDLTPYILGLPFSFAWTVGWLVVMFVALVLLYRTDAPDPAD